MFYKIVLLLQRWPFTPGAQVLHPPSLLSHVSLFKKFPLHLSMHPTPKVPFLYAEFLKTKDNVCFILVKDNSYLLNTTRVELLTVDYIKEFAYVYHTYPCSAILAYIPRDRCHECCYRRYHPNSVHIETNSFPHNAHHHILKIQKK